MKKRKIMITGVAIGLLMIGIIVVTGNPVKKLFDVPELELANIESVILSRYAGGTSQWMTSDSEIIKNLVEHFERLRLFPVQGGAGGYLNIRFNLKTPINNQEFLDVHLLGSQWYLGTVKSNGTITAYKVIWGAKSEEEWSAILEQCQMIR